MMVVESLGYFKYLSTMVMASSLYELQNCGVGLNGVVQWRLCRILN